MQTSTEGIYRNSLVAVFKAAFRLGYDPYALAAQAKLDVTLTPATEGDGGAVDASLVNPLRPVPVWKRAKAKTLQ